MPSPVFGDISINNSSNVVVGNIVKIKGDLILKVHNNNERCGEPKSKEIANKIGETKDNNIILKTSKSENIFHFLYFFI